MDQLYNTYRTKNLKNNKANNEKLAKVQSRIKNVEGLYFYVNEWGIPKIVSMTIVVKHDMPQEMDNYVLHILKIYNVEYEIFRKPSKGIKIFDKNFNKNVFLSI
jgi:hypothetical protein